MQHVNLSTYWQERQKNTAMYSFIFVDILVGEMKNNARPLNKCCFDCPLTFLDTQLLCHFHLYLVVLVTDMCTKKLKDLSDIKNQLRKRTTGQVHNTGRDIDMLR